MEVMRRNRIQALGDHRAHRESHERRRESCRKAGASDALANPIIAEQLLSDCALGAPLGA